MKKTITLQLNPAEVLYRKKILLRRRENMPSNLLTLPSFKWDIEKSRMAGVDDREILKTWMRYLAWVLAACAKATGAKTLSFVALALPASDEKTFSLRVSCPYPQILAPLKSRSELQKIAEANSGISIHHKYGLTDLLCPVAFVYESAGNHVLIINEHHLSNPMQFLEIDKCRTTSGFLNFLGSFNLLQELDDASSLADKLPQLMRDAMHARSDEWLRWFFHSNEKSVLFDPSRIFVDQKNPERFFYHYSLTETE